MATEAVLEHTHETDEKLWDGGKEPFKASYGKLMMWYFLLSDAFTFAGFLIAYGALRFSSPIWPVPDVVFEKIPFFSDVKAPLVFVTFMTFVLIASSGGIQGPPMFQPSHMLRPISISRRAACSTA